MSWPQSWCVSVCRVCVCVCGWICLPSGCRQLQAVFNDSLRCLSVTSGMDAVRSEARSLQTCIQHVDGSHTTLFAGAARLHKHTLSHTLVFAFCVGCRQIHWHLHSSVCVCVLCVSVVYWDFLVFLLKIPAGWQSSCLMFCRSASQLRATDSVRFNEWMH